MKTAASILCQAWAIHPYGIRDIAQRLKIVTDGKFSSETRPTHDIFGQELPQMKISDGLAIIPIKGPLLNGADPFLKSFGFVSQSDVSADLDKAVELGATDVLLDVDSPGGSVEGTPELAAKVAGMRGKTNVVSYSSGMNGSAAYYITSGADAMFATQSSITGSIGTIIETVDMSEMLADLGIKVDQIKSGEFKGMLSPYVPMTDSQREFLQNFVDESAGAFKDHVTEMRADIDPELMDGQFYGGIRAAENGFIDGVVSNMAQAIALIR